MTGLNQTSLTVLEILFDCSNNVTASCRESRQHYRCIPYILMYFYAPIYGGNLFIYVKENSGGR